MIPLPVTFALVALLAVMYAVYLVGGMKGWWDAKAQKAARQAKKVRVHKRSVRR
jgi:hypothetical protein